MHQSISGNGVDSSSVSKAGFSPPSCSAVVPARTVSSLRWDAAVPSSALMGTGTISASKPPLAAVRAALWCEPAEYASRSSRSSFHRAATSSAQTPWFTRPAG